MARRARFASRWLRTRAFLIDIFLIYVPILYVVTYLILGSKEAFRHNPYMVFACWVAFGLIQACFFAYKGQSPGCKAYNVYLLKRKSLQKVGFMQAFARYLIFILSSALLFGLIISFFRKDKLCLHDILSFSVLVEEKVKS